VILLSFIIFAVKVKNTMVDINTQLNEMRQDVNEVKSLYRSEISELIKSIRGLIK